MKPATFYLNKKKKKNDRILTYLIINLSLFVSSQDDDQNDSPLSCCSLLLMSQNDWTKAYIRQIAWKMFAFFIFQKKKCIERCLSTSRPFLTSCWALITYEHLSYISDSRTKLFIPPFCLMATYFSPILNISDCCCFLLFFFHNNTSTAA